MFATTLVASRVAPKGVPKESSRLANLRIFSGPSGDVLDEFASRLQEAELLNGSILVREGDFADKFFVVLEGEVEVQRDFHHVATLGPGDFFGEMGLIQGARRNARIIAQSRCRVAWMMAWDFDRMTTEYPEVAARIQAVVDERMAAVPDHD